jgi:hypothetical protein
MRSWAAIGAIAVAMMLGHADGARAEMSAKQLLAGIATTTTSEGVGFALEMAAIGLTWANSDLVIRKAAPLFCPPKELTFTRPLLIDLLREAVARDPKLGDAPFGMSLMLAFKRKYPCRSQ